MLKEKLIDLYRRLEEKFSSHFGFGMGDVTFSKVVDYLHSPRDSSSLAVARILFGLATLFDIPDERGGASMDRRWGDTKTCHFPLFPFLKGLPMPYMAIVYAALWFGALGIMLGYRYRLSAVTFALCYWYIFLIEKSYWNNHSYLFGLVATLLATTSANCYWSLDAHFDRRTYYSETVPYWNYFVLKYQFFILYFVAGLKKGTAEWLSGYSLPNLSNHWVFTPFKLFLSVPQIDYLIVHWFAFVFDLSIAFWMMWKKTRHIAMVFCAAFHLMNIRLFRIGMFPWVCLATMPLFYPFHWPKIFFKYKCNLIAKFGKNNQAEDKTAHNVEKDKDISETDEIKENEQKTEELTIAFEKSRVKNKSTVYLIILYMALQGFLPYSHFITKGYNNWTKGLYGYSWDMMVHTWDTNSVVVKVVDNGSHEEYFIDPYIWTPNDRWTRHGDMVYQYAHCLKNNLIEAFHENNLHLRQKDNRVAMNVSVYIDVWCSMNGRFQQRMFDSKVDLLQASWSPFGEVSWLMPLLADAENWRHAMDGIRENVFRWNNYSDVIFVGDFPGYHLENFLPPELVNVTLSVLEGQVAYEEEVENLSLGQSHVLKTEDHIFINSGKFHKIINIGRDPAFYMYTFMNKTEVEMPENLLKDQSKPKLPITLELWRRFGSMVNFFHLVFSSLNQLFFRLPVSLVWK